MNALLPVYRRSEITIERGEGVYLYAPDGTRYLDFASGIAVNALGHSHPHLVNEFLKALVQNRDPWPNAVQSANWTCVGICAHDSAVKGGEIVKLPAFTLA